MSREELDFIAALAISRDLWVVADEVYATITFERPHLSIASLPRMADHPPEPVRLSPVQGEPLRVSDDRCTSGLRRAFVAVDRFYNAMTRRTNGRGLCAHSVVSERKFLETKHKK